MDQPLDCAFREPVLELTLNRPACRNALSRELIARLTDAMQAAADDPAVRCVILTGAPPAFCSGLDLREVAHKPAEQAAHDTTAVLALYETIERVPKPVIAAVNGPAVADELRRSASSVCLTDGARIRLADFLGVQRFHSGP